MVDPALRRGHTCRLIELGLLANVERDKGAMNQSTHTRRSVDNSRHKVNATISLGDTLPPSMLAIPRLGRHLQRLTHLDPSLHRL